MAEREKRFFNSYSEFAEAVAKDNPESNIYESFPDAETAGKWILENNAEQFSNISIVEGYGDIDFAHGLRREAFGEEVHKGFSALSEVLSTRPDKTLRGLSKFAGGILDRFMQPSVESKDQYIQDLIDQGVPEEEAMKIGQGYPGLTEPGASESVDAMVGQFEHDLSPAGLSENFYRGLADASMAIPGGQSFGALSKIQMLRNFPNLKKLIEGIGRGRDIVDPTTMPLAVLGETARATKAGARKLAPKFAAGAKKVKEGFKRTLKDVRRLDSSTSQETLAAIMGFTTSVGARGIEKMIDNFGTVVLGGANFDDVFIASKLAKKKDGITKLLKTGFEMTDIWSDNLKFLYRIATEKAFTGKHRHKKQKMIETGAMEGKLKDTLEEFGFTFKKITPIGENNKPLKPRWVVGAHPTKSSVTPVGVDRQIVADAAEMFLNTTRPSASGKLGKINAFELHQMRIGLDDTISKIAVDGASARTKIVLSQFRDTVAKHLENNLGPEYKAAMLEYSSGRADLDLVDQYMGLRPGMINDPNRVISELGELDLTSYETTLNKLAEVFSDTEQRGLRPDILRKLEEQAGSGVLTPMLLGRMSAPIFGSGLAVKSEISQSLRHIIGVVGAVEVGGAAAMGIPAFMLFSPRLATHALLKGKGLKKKYNRSRLEKAAKRLQKADKDTGFKLSALVKRTGWNLAQLVERLEADTGQNLAEDTDEVMVRDMVNMATSPMTGAIDILSKIQSEAPRVDAFTGEGQAPRTTDSPSIPKPNYGGGLSRSTR